MSFRRKRTFLKQLCLHISICGSEEVEEVFAPELPVDL